MFEMLSGMLCCRCKWHAIAAHTNAQGFARKVHKLMVLHLWLNGFHHLVLPVSVSHLPSLVLQNPTAAMSVLCCHCLEHCIRISSRSSCNGPKLHAHFYILQSLFFSSMPCIATGCLGCTNSALCLARSFHALGAPVALPDSACWSAPGGSAFSKPPQSLLSLSTPINSESLLFGGLCSRLIWVILHSLLLSELGVRVARNRQSLLASPHYIDHRTVGHSFRPIANHSEQILLSECCLVTDC